MGYHSEVSKACPHQIPKSATKVHISIVKGSKSSMLLDKSTALGSVNHVQSSTVRGSEIIQNINDSHSLPSKTSASSKKHGVEKKAKEAEELVKYMSKVPRYLQQTERGDNFQGRALNFGVLDWGHVEKWKNKQEHVPGRKSSSDTPSSLATLKSSTLSSKSNNSSLLQRKQSVVNSLDHRQSSSPSNECHSQILDEKPSDHDAASQRSKIPEHVLVSKSQLYKKDLSLGSDRVDFKLKKGKTKASGLDVISANTFGPLQDKTSSSDSKGDDVPVSTEDKINGQESESLRRPEQFREKNKPILEPAKLLVPKPSDQLDKKTQAVAIGRDSSQNFQLRNSLHRKTESLNFKAELGSQSQLKTTCLTDTSGSLRTDDCGCLDGSLRDQAKTNTKARLSPLRRILDPIVKSRALNHLNPVQDRPTTCGSRSPPKIQLSSSTGQSVKKNLNFSVWGSGNTHGSSLQDDNKHVASTKHGLLQLLFKNGLPLFTFSINNDGDILAATMRKIFIPKKDAFDWIYTFHSVHGIKKSGWLNQGRKGRRQGHPCNLIGQMNISSSLCRKFTTDVSAEHLMVTEFVLLGAETRHAASEMLEIVPKGELAAIVIEVLLEKTASFNAKNDVQQNHRDISAKDLTNQLEETKYSCCLLENLVAGTKKEPKSLSSVTVILPGGIHGLPAKEAGKPSPLIDRWKSGGLCDCGGWDVGCRLTVLSNPRRQCEESLSSTQGCSTLDDALQVSLFVQGTREDGRHAFCLKAIKEGLYSVEFSESFSSLQAFSICLAILHNKKPAIISPVDNLHREKTLQETIVNTEDKIKIHSRDPGEAYVSNVPYPPLSPVGRV